MSTETPYSNAWTARTWARMQDLDVGSLELDLATGLLGSWHASFIDGEPVTLELAGPVDEWLDKLEEEAEARKLELPDIVEVQPGGRRQPHLARRVDVDLGPLCDYDVVLHGERR